MKEFTLPKETHIKFIMDNFDFQKVHEVMKYLNWTWAFSDGVPTIPELKKEANRLLNDIYDSRGWISTGGFKATKNHDNLVLEFIVTDFDSEILNYGDQYEKMKNLKKMKKKNKLRKKKIENIENLNLNENN